MRGQPVEVLTGVANHTPGGAGSGLGRRVGRRIPRPAVSGYEKRLAPLLDSRQDTGQVGVHDEQR